MILIALIALFVPSLAVLLALSVPAVLNTYTSSPGFTSPEYWEEFYATSPTCHGYSILLNAEAVETDAEGISFCVGVVTRK